jgi:hypothetical protein
MKRELVVRASMRWTEFFFLAPLKFMVSRAGYNNDETVSLLGISLTEDSWVGLIQDDCLFSSKGIAVAESIIYPRQSVFLFKLYGIRPIRLRDFILYISHLSNLSLLRLNGFYGHLTVVRFICSFVVWLTRKRLRWNK